MTDETPDETPEDALADADAPSEVEPTEDDVTAVEARDALAQARSRLNVADKTFTLTVDVGENGIGTASVPVYAGNVTDAETDGGQVTWVNLSVADGPLTTIVRLTAADPGTHTVTLHLKGTP